MFQGKTHVVEAIKRAFDDTYDPNTLARVAWSTITEPGDPYAGQLIARLGSTGALDALADETVSALPNSPLEYLRRTALPKFSIPTVVGTLARTVDQQLRVLTPASISWPHNLDAMGASAPLALWVRGDHSLLRLASVAVTGGQTTTPFGFSAATDLSSGLAERRYTVMAGGSYGIDAAVHRAALNEKGRTVAVLASPADELFPASNASLLEEIAREGAVVSERPPCTPANQWRFGRRNQVLGALAAKTIIIEASLRAGVLAAARQAVSLGRPVGVFAGPENSAASAGCNDLLQEEGVTAVTGLDSVLALGNP